MKQPVNDISVMEEEGSWWVDIGDGDGYSATGVGLGLSEASAWKAAKRRLGRLLKEVEREIKKGETK